MPSKNAQPASPTKNAATGPKLSVKSFRLGRIKAAVWENEADRKKFFNVTFARTYMDEARNFHDTDSYGRDDLPLIAKLAIYDFKILRVAEDLGEEIVEDSNGVGLVDIFAFREREDGMKLLDAGDKPVFDAFGNRGHSEVLNAERPGGDGGG